MNFVKSVTQIDSLCFCKRSSWRRPCTILQFAICHEEEEKQKRRREGPAVAVLWQKPRSSTLQRHSVTATESKMAGAEGDDSLYPIAVLIDELRNEDVQVVILLLS